jgi:hypothetical protein
MSNLKLQSLVDDASPTIANAILGDVHYQKFISKFPNSILVDKIWGNGEKIIYMGFNEHRRIGLKYIIRVDSSVSVIDMHELAEEIEDYLVEEFGMFDRHEDFEEWCNENNHDISKCSPSCFCNIHNKIFDEWLFDQFPQVDISGGCSNWDDVWNIA